MSLRSRKRGALIGAAAIGAAVAAGVGAGAGAADPASAASAPQFSHLTAQQIQTRESGKQQSVIVVFNNQLGNLPANAAHRQARQSAAASMQAPLVSQLHQVGASKITDLSLVNAVAATMPAAEAQALRQNASVKEVAPDLTVTMGDANSTTPAVASSQVAQGAAVPTDATSGQQMCSASPGQPMLEPEELTSIHDASDDPTATDEASSVATGTGVVIGNVNADTLAGNPNLIRPDGSHVVIDAPDPNENKFDDEFNGDVSTMGSQGTVVYNYEDQLPLSNIPPTCTFVIKGDATGASILTTGEFSDTNAAGQTVAPESQVIAGLQSAVDNGVSVVSESYGFGALPDASLDLLIPSNQAMVKAGVTVVESSGDSGSSGTVEAPADAPDIIDVGGTNDLRLTAQADGYTNGWLDDNMTTLSSGGTAPDGRVVDLVAPGYLGLASAGPGGDPDLATEAFGGTSQAAPFVSGAAADVIQAYRDTHKGTSPTPAVVKQLLTSTATDIGADSDQQGAGLLNVYKAVQAARQAPGATKSTSDTSQVIARTTQLDVEGDGGSTVEKSLKLYNASSTDQTVTGTYRTLGDETSFGDPVTESITAPAAGSVIPEQGAQAATPVTFNVPAGTDVLDADMRWPDPTNSSKNILSFILTDPSGKLAQFSYDYGAANTPAASPDIQHSTVEHPMAGQWTAQIVWADGRGHVQTPPNVPGPYRGAVTFQASGQNFTTSPASDPVTIAAHGSTTVPLSIAMPQAAGDNPQSVQFTADDGSVLTTVPIARRVLVNSVAGSTFDAHLTSSVSRGAGQIKTFYVKVPNGQKDLDISFNAPDFAPNDPVYYYLYSPAGQSPALAKQGEVEVSSTDTTPTADNPTGNGSLIVHTPHAGLWEIEVMQGATTDGSTFSNDVIGTINYNQLGVFPATGIPQSKSKTIPTGTKVPISVTVTNTTDHVADFALEGGSDITGGNAATPKQLAPGATGTLTATVSPKAPAGTVVKGDLSVVMSTDFFDAEPAIGLPTSISDLHDFAYAYTVGAASGG
jgi:hypothetical protein